MRLSSYSIIVVFVAMMLLGAILLPRLGVQLYPSAELPSLIVTFGWSDTPAVMVEREVTSVIEGALSTLRNIDQISSVSFHGSGQIRLRFNKNTEVEPARFEVASKIRRIYSELPNGVSFPTITVNRAAGRQTPLLTYVIMAPPNKADFKQYPEQHLLPALTRIKGVDQISFYGTTDNEFRVIYDAKKLHFLNMNVNDLLSAINQHFTEKPVGMGYRTNQPQAFNTAEQDKKNKSTGNHITKDDFFSKLPVILQAVPVNIQGWSEIPVGKAGHRLIYLTDVAEVRLMEVVPDRYYRFNGRNTIGMQVFAAAGENQIRLADAVRRKIEEIQQALPPGWQIVQTYDNTEHIRKDLGRLGLRMLFSLSMLLLFVISVTLSIRYLLLMVITIAANLLIAVLWYYFGGIEMHLYSLAGITVSFGIIIDNGIVMVEHMLHHKNRKVFSAILAATLTTAGCLSVIFLLDAKQQALLQDFAAVMLVNLLLSLTIAWFFVPALFARLRVSKTNTNTIRNRRIVILRQAYFRCLLICRRYRWLLLLLLVLGFGLPVHRMPAHISHDSMCARFYNKTIGSRLYQNKIRSTAEKLLGGSFRVFSQNVFSGAYFADPDRTVINIHGQMPYGASIEQLNETFLIMERFLQHLPGISQFESRILSPLNGIIRVLPDESHDRGLLPVFLQEKIIARALTIGGVDWRIEGAGRGFSNLHGTDNITHSSIVLEGYNYDQLYRYAELLRQRASENPRVNNAEISGGGNRTGHNRPEFHLLFNSEQLSLKGLSPNDIYTHLAETTLQQHATTVFHKNRPVNIILAPCTYDAYSFYDLMHKPLLINGNSYKTGDILSINRQISGNDIHKHNQQYRLHVNYSFFGPYTLEQRVSDALIDEFNDMALMGYRAFKPDFTWRTAGSKHFLLVLLVVVIIYFICSILLESLMQPLAIISLIPVSFTGLFLTFYFLNIDFDQGGVAAFILLSGLSVNAGLYILNDYNGFIKRSSAYHPLRSYLKAFQYKLFPVMLTISSTLIGLLPFVIGNREPFWFAFAAGTMGGLVFSVLGILVLFPVLIIGKNR